MLLIGCMSALLVYQVVLEAAAFRIIFVANLCMTYYFPYLAMAPFRCDYEVIDAARDPWAASEVGPRIFISRADSLGMQLALLITPSSLLDLLKSPRLYPRAIHHG